MVSFVKSKNELGTNSNKIEDKRAARASGDAADSPSEEKARVSGVERYSKSTESEPIARVLENDGFAEELKAMARVCGESGLDKEMVTESDQGLGDDTYIEAPRVKDSANERLFMHQPLAQSTIQLKSILKKQTGDEAGKAAGDNGPNMVVEGQHV
ncbi:hypothetical protein GH714_042181 [Hevea brasiliensis]|uniref:Uncharacterized protein n=1 Tax=Hevea brasiliensis TaxID=3981 RepID=A0A6A6MTE6_HEVBR|nr:hypothetical protein GH714_042181 [Hevea brasiliensis]